MAVACLALELASQVVYCGTSRPGASFTSPMLLEEQGYVYDGAWMSTTAQVTLQVVFQNFLVGT